MSVDEDDEEGWGCLVNASAMQPSPKPPSEDEDTGWDSVIAPLNLSHTTPASLPEAQLIAYYLREPPGETPNRNKLLHIHNGRSFFRYLFL